MTWQVPVRQRVVGFVMVRSGMAVMARQGPATVRCVQARPGEARQLWQVPEWRGSASQVSERRGSARRGRRGAQVNRLERTKTIEWVREYTCRFEADADRLAEIAKASRPDGFPSSSMNGSGSPGSISDRTGRTATALADGDLPMMASKADEAFTHLAAALKSLELADKARRAALPLKTLPVSTDLRGCKSHARLKDHQGHPLFEPRAFDKSYDRRAEIVEHSGLCQRCYEWSVEHKGQYPSTWLLERLRGGARLTTKLVAEAEERDAKTRVA